MPVYPSWPYGTWGTQDNTKQNAAKWTELQEWMTGQASTITKVGQ